MKPELRRLSVFRRKNKLQLQSLNGGRVEVEPVVPDECRGENRLTKLLGEEQTLEPKPNPISSSAAAGREGALSQPYHSTGIISFGKEYQLI